MASWACKIGEEDILDAHCEGGLNGWRGSERTGTGCEQKGTSHPCAGAYRLTPVSSRLFEEHHVDAGRNRSARLPNNPGPILVLVDHLPGNEAFVEARAQQVAIGLRHFAEQTSWQYVDAASPEKTQSAAAVVYLGLNGNAPPSPDALAQLRRAHHLIVSRYHLATLREAGVAFQHTVGGNDIVAPPNTAVRWRIRPRSRMSFKTAMRSS